MRPRFPPGLSRAFLMALMLLPAVAFSQDAPSEREAGVEPQEPPAPLPPRVRTEPPLPAVRVLPIEQIPPAAFTTLRANPDYAAGSLHKWFLGTHYRTAWATPVRVEVLDLSGFAGGLRPDKKGGGKETRWLRFESADGRRFRVRSVDKDPTPALPELLQDTIVDQIAQDQISAHHPAAALVVDALAEAAGILHVKHRMVVLPDDPRLGEFRREFAGMLGMMEEDPRVEDPVTPGFERFRKLEEEWVEVEKLIDASPANRVDTRTFLKMRLFDLWIGDWDRHADQWVWGLDRESGVWMPVPEDRDMPFSKFDGILMGMARFSQPRLVNFESKYTDLTGLTWNSRFLDRRLLAGFEEPAFREAARELKKAMTDRTIEDAVRRMPPEYFQVTGPTLSRRLKARRDHLEEQASRFYRRLAEDVEVHATDQPERVEVHRRDDGAVTVRVSAAEGAGTEPYFARTFRPQETDEIRIFMKGGDDQAISIGDAGDMKVRVIGGPGNDVADDRRGGSTQFYDHLGRNQAFEVERESSKPYTHPLDRHDNPLRDWGTHFLPRPWAAAGGDLGLLAGAELTWTRFGFRKHPWGSRQTLAAGYSFGRQGVLAEYEGVFRQTNSPDRAHIDARYSEIDVLRFHGFGNDTTDLEGSGFFRNDQRQFLFSPGYTWGDRVALTLAPIVKYTTTQLRAGSFLDRTRPFGVEDFGQVGMGGELLLDGRNNRRLPTMGAALSVGGAYYPGVWSVEKAFGEAHGEVAAYLTAPVPLRPGLALRAAGKRVFGDRFPFFEAAFIGGPDTVRSLRRERFAGDTAVWANAELRFRLGTMRILVPEPFGVFFLYDTGRVWVDDRSPGGWHNAIGGGIWLAVLKPENAVTLAIARGDDRRTRVYFHGGFAF
jgi:hypothetical protein